MVTIDYETDKANTYIINFTLQNFRDLNIVVKWYVLKSHMNNSNISQKKQCNLIAVDFVMGWILFPQIPTLMSQLPVPQNVTIFENRAYKGVDKLKWGP